MKKVLKKILFFTDDFDQEMLDMSCSDGDFFYNDESNWCRFKIEKITSFKEVDRRKKYDVVLIDFGLLGNREKQGEEENIEGLRYFHNKGIPLAYVGGLPERSNAEARRFFPRIKFLHNLPCSSLSDMEFMLYRHIFIKKENG